MLIVAVLTVGCDRATDLTAPRTNAPSNIGISDPAFADYEAQLGEISAMYDGVVAARKMADMNTSIAKQESCAPLGWTAAGAAGLTVLLIGVAAAQIYAKNASAGQTIKEAYAAAIAAIAANEAYLSCVRS